MSKEIFKFRDADRDTTIRLVKTTLNKFVLEVTGDDKVLRTPVVDSDFDFVSEEYSCFVMGYINGLKQDHTNF